MSTDLEVFMYFTELGSWDRQVH